MKIWKKVTALMGIAALGATLMVGCGGGAKTEAPKTDAAKTEQKAETNAGSNLKALKGTITADGSSTVFPLTEAVAEEFRKVAPDVKATVGVSGTGGGFKKFGAGETDISNASRPIKDSEIELAKKNNVEYIELQVAIDGLSVVVSKQNDFCQDLTVKELHELWKPGSTITKWNQIRPTFPDQPIKLYGAGTDSGTFDYFTEVINGKSGASRSDYTASEDDNVLVKGVQNDKYALGYFGLSYYEENKDKLRAVKIDEGKGKGPVYPEPDKVASGEYSPLARPSFIYVKKSSMQRPEVKEFINFYLDNAIKLSKQVGMVPMTEKILAEQKAKIK